MPPTNPINKKRLRFIVAITSPLICILLLGISQIIAAVGKGGMAEPKGSQVILQPKEKPAEGFAVMVTGNWQSHLEPCGCTDIQLGGLDRRTKVMNQIADDPCSRLLIDAGPLIDEQDRLSQIKFEYFLYTLHRLDYDAICLTAYELVYLNEKISLPTDQFSSIICTNMPEEKRNKYQTRPYLKKTLIRKDKKINTLTFGLVVANDLEDPRFQEKLQLTDPLEALIDELRNLNVDPDKSSDKHLVVVLLNRNDDDLAKAVHEIEAVDIIAMKGLSDKPELCPLNGNGKLVINTGQMGKYISVIDVPVKKPDQIKAFSFKPVPIDSRFPRDESIVNIIDEYQMRLQMDELIKKLPRKPLEEGQTFVGNSQCEECHQEIYDTWKGLKHYQAMNTLREVNRDHNPECVACHTVGMHYESGYVSMEATPDLGNVGCEMCHGPGFQHILAPEDEYRIIFTSCETCHDAENSPAFEGNREEYFEGINHWDGKRKYWK